MKCECGSTKFYGFYPAPEIIESDIIDTKDLDFEDAEEKIIENYYRQPLAMQEQFIIECANCFKTKEEE